jgi:GNAT superfamily N-acetyltransferase
MYDISTEQTKLDIDAIHAYLTRSYWSPGIPREVVERATRNSLCFGAYDAEGKQVGFARVVTDHATFAYLCDVYVLEAHQGHGIGRKLMQAFVAHPAFTGARRVMLATRDAHGLYAKFGFASVANSRVLMEILRADIYRAPAATA